MKRQTGPADTHLPAIGRGGEFLVALNAAAASLQRAARSEAEVFHAFREQIAGLGLRGGLSLLDETGERLVVRAVAYPGRMLRVMAELENLVGLKTEGFTFPVAQVDAYRQVLESGQAVFISDSAPAITQMLPQAARRFAGPLLKVLGAAPSLYAPLITAGKVFGVLNVTGADLTSDDLPAIQAFANHIAVALENVGILSALRESEQKFRSFVEQSQDGIVLVDETGNIVEWNRGEEQITGIKAEETLGKPIWDLEIQVTPAERRTPELRAQMKAMFQTYFATGEAVRLDPLHEREIVRADGQRRILQNMAFPIHLLERRYLLGSIDRDITEHKRAEEEIRLLQTVTQAVSEAADFHSALSVALQKVCEASGWEYGEAWVPRPDGSALELSPAWYGTRKELGKLRELSEGFSFTPGTGLPGRVWSSKQSEWIPDVAVNGDVFLRAQFALELGLKAGLGAPICVGDQVLAVLGYFTSKTREEDRQLVETVSAVAAQLGLVLQRKRAEEELRESEKRYRSLFENMLEGFAYCKMLYEDNQPQDFLYLDVNSTFEKLTGLKDVVGRKVTEVIPGIRDSHPELFEIYGRVALTGQPERFETYLETLGIWFSISVYSTRKEHFIAVFDNVTARKRAEEALKLFRTLIDRSNDGIEVIDPETARFLDVNEKSCLDLGYSREELLSLRVFDIDPTVDQSTFTRSVEEIRKTGFETWEGYHQRKDGSTFPVEVSIKYVQLDRAYLVTVARDITERKRAGEALRKSEYEQRLLLDNIDEIVYRVEMRPEALFNGTVQSVSGQVERLIGYRPDEFLRDDGLWFSLIHPEDIPALQASTRTMLNTRGPGTREYRVRHKQTGEYHWMEDRITPQVNAEGDVVGQFGVARDITERKRAEQALYRVNRALRTLSEFNQAIVRASQESDLLHEACRNLVEVGGYRLAWIGFAEQDEHKTVRPVAQMGYEEGYLETANITWADTERGRGPAGTAIRTGKPSIIQNTLTDPRCEPWREEAARRGYASSIALPLLMGEQAGALNVYAAEPDVFTPEEVNLLAELADDLAYGITALRTDAERRQAVESLRKRSEEIALLYEAGIQVGNTLDLETIYQTTREVISKTMKCDDLFVSSYSPKDDLIRCVYAWHEGKRLDASAFPPIPLEPEGSGTQSVVIRTGEALLLADYKTYWNTSRTKYLVGDEGVIDQPVTDEVDVPHSALIVPLWLESQVVGVIQAFSYQSAYTEDDLRIVRALAPQIAAATANASLYAQAQAELAERKRAAEALGESESLYRSLVESLPVGVGLADADGNLITFNEVMLAPGGYTREDFSGAASVGALYYDPDERSRVLMAFQQQGFLDRQEVRFRRKDGSFYYALLTLRPVMVKGQRCLQAMVEDITERKRRERELEALVTVATALRAAPTRGDILRVVVNRTFSLMSLDGVALVIRSAVTREWVAVLARGAWENWTGVTFKPGEGLTGHVIATGRPYVNDDVRTDARLARPDLVGDVPAVASVPLIAEGETIGMLWAGRKTHILANDVSLLAAIADMAATAVHRAALFEQVQNHALELEQSVADRTHELAEANERLLDLDRLKTKFVSDVSHELRTPVTNLSLYLELLEHGKPEKRDQYRVILKEQAARLGNLIEDILDLTRLERDKERVAFGSVDLNAAAQAVVTSHQAQAEAADLRLIFEPGADLPPVRAEIKQLTQIVTNLVSNALNYTPAGQVRVSTRLDLERGATCLEVQDTGIGIEPADQPHLFERFYRGRHHGQSDIPGSGLGLSIVKEIVDLHGGTITFTSEVGAGTTFTVCLPLHPSIGAENT